MKKKQIIGFGGFGAKTLRKFGQRIPRVFLVAQEVSQWKSTTIGLFCARDFTDLPGSTIFACFEA